MTIELYYKWEDDEYHMLFFHQTGHYDERWVEETTKSEEIYQLGLQYGDYARTERSIKLNEIPIDVSYCILCDKEDKQVYLRNDIKIEGIQKFFTKLVFKYEYESITTFRLSWFSGLGSILCQGVHESLIVNFDFESISTDFLLFVLILAILILFW